MLPAGLWGSRGGPEAAERRESPPSSGRGVPPLPGAVVAPQAGVGAPAWVPAQQHTSGQSSGRGPPRGPRGREEGAGAPHKHPKGQGQRTEAREGQRSCARPCVRPPASCPAGARCSRCLMGQRVRLPARASGAQGRAACRRRDTAAAPEGAVQPRRVSAHLWERVCAGFLTGPGPPTGLPRARTCVRACRVRQASWDRAPPPGRNVRPTAPLPVLAGGTDCDHGVPAAPPLPPGCWQNGMGP